jgi:hypothetical protein
MRPTHTRCQLHVGTRCLLPSPRQLAQCLLSRSRLADQRSIGHHPMSRLRGRHEGCWLSQGHSPLIAMAATQPTVDDRSAATVVTAFLVPSTRCLHVLAALPPPPVPPKCRRLSLNDHRPFPIFPFHPPPLQQPIASPISRILLYASAVAVAANPSRPFPTLVSSTHLGLVDQRRRSNELRLALRCGISKSLALS